MICFFGRRICFTGQKRHQGWRPPSSVRPLERFAPALVLLLGLLLSSPGCATRHATPGQTAFEFHKDTFAFANELVWEYREDPATGQYRHQRRIPKPEYTHHCFVVARAAKQFFHHAQFEPDLPKTSRGAYEAAIRQILSRNPREISAPEERVLIPGYDHLHEFSKEWAAAIKDEAGTPLNSYVQRGHWRMIFPFSRRHQNHTASKLQERVEANHVPVVHLVTFPQLSINHAVVIFDSVELPNGIKFIVYDPNNPHQPTELLFEKKSRRFVFPRNNYFPGGAVNVYEVYRGICY